MILCHKCSGVLSHGDNEDVSSLYPCGCISSYVRGFEPIVNRDEAIVAQVKACKERISLYIEQERQPHEFLSVQYRLDLLQGTRTVRIMHLAAFAKLIGLDVEEAYGSASHVFSFGDADDTLVSVGRLCAVLGIDEPVGLDDIFIGLGS